jgi:hypothetical protein
MLLTADVGVVAVEVCANREVFIGDAMDIGSFFVSSRSPWRSS